MPHMICFSKSLAAGAALGLVLGCGGSSSPKASGAAGTPNGGDTGLGGGNTSRAVFALKDTSTFLKDQKQISSLQPDYSKYVTPDYVDAAMKLK